MQAPTQPDDEVRCHRIRAVVDLLGISERKVYDLINAGELVATKLGTRTVVRHRDLVDYLDRQPHIEPTS